MSGTAEHRRRGEDTRSVSLYVGIRFTSINTVAQVLVDDSENYRVIQNYGDSPTTTVVTDAGADGKTILGDFGLRAEDLAMTFLFWQFVEEFPREKALGRPCRVFLLESPEKSERVRVFIDEQYFFPIRVEWFRRPPHGPTSAFEAKPYRTLEAESFRREEDFWMVGTLGLFGPGWRTKIQFDKCRGGYPENEPKEPVFRIPVRKSVDAPQND
jgi:hypothetical protein